MESTITAAAAAATSNSNNNHTQQEQLQLDQKQQPQQDQNQQPLPVDQKQQQQQQQQQQYTANKPHDHRIHTNTTTTVLQANRTNSNKNRKRRLVEDTNTATTHTAAAATATDNTSSAIISADKNSSSNNNKMESGGWRVKLYRLNADGSWDDCGTGRILCLYKQAINSNNNNNNNNTTSPTITSTNNEQQLHHHQQQQPSSVSGGEPTLCMYSEPPPSRVLLRTRILLRDAYQRQGDNIITWCEPYDEETNPTSVHASTNNTTSSSTNSLYQDQGGGPVSQGVDLALSFQDNAGCLDIWRQITHVQTLAAATVVASSSSAITSTLSTTISPSSSVTDMAHAIAVAHHAALQQQQQQQQHAMWMHAARDARLMQQQDVDDEDDVGGHNSNNNHNAMAAAAAAAASVASYHHHHNHHLSTAFTESSSLLPVPPTLQNLEEVADLIAAAQQAMQQRDSLAMYISQQDCAYLKALLNLFPAAEIKQDYGALATLAACIKTILLLNDPAIIECIVSQGFMYEQVCSALEYDPDLRDKANHRWFLRERCKFRTVVWMDDEALVETIHRSFRVTYLRDTLLRPTMDESSLSTLSSLQTFTHADVVKGVTCPLQGSRGDSYLIKVIRVLGIELGEISTLEWAALEEDKRIPYKAVESPQSAEPTKEKNSSNTTWRQHLCPQDGSLQSRKIRRRGCLSFFRELFNMVRISLQQSDKDDFYAAIVGMEVELQENSDGTPPALVNILSLLGSVISDPNADVTEISGILEIIGGIAIHDPSHIRRHCLEYHEIWKRSPRAQAELTGPAKPYPNDRRQILFRIPPNDILASLLFLMAAETDAGILLQTSEIMRIILETDMMGEHGPMGTIGVEEMEGPGLHDTILGEFPNGVDQATRSGEGGSDQSQFLALFYEYYVHWLVAPFQYTIVYPASRFPDSVIADPAKSKLLQRLRDTFHRGVSRTDTLLRTVPPCSIRGSFAVELLSFCVRAHLYRMKFFLLRSRVLGNVLKLLSPTASATSGDRCLKLAALRFLRSILSVKDEFYHRHIIQHNLFAPVFDAFRANPVGDNLVSSAIVEMCDFIQGQKIKSLIEYIATQHLITPGAGQKSLEEVATPYVNTLTTLRKTYDSNQHTDVSDGLKEGPMDHDSPNSPTSYGNRLFPTMGGRRSEPTSERAMEDQRKFRVSGSEESYFDDDDDEDDPLSPRSTSMTTEQPDGQLVDGTSLSNHTQTSTNMFLQVGRIDDETISDYKPMDIDLEPIL